KPARGGDAEPATIPMALRQALTVLDVAVVEEVELQVELCLRFDLGDDRDIVPGRPFVAPADGLTQHRIVTQQFDGVVIGVPSSNALDLPARDFPTTRMLTTPAIHHGIVDQLFR